MNVYQHKLIALEISQQNMLITQIIIKWEFNC